MSTIAIIPARGGSKRLPRKNILPIAEKPVIAYVIEAARAAKLFDEVYVSTEDDEIAVIATQYGAQVIRRPMQHAEDHSTVVDVCLHALSVKPEIEVLCCIYATAALLTSDTLIEAHKVFSKNDAIDFLMGMSQYEHHPVQALKVDAEGFCSYMWPEWLGVKSQDYPELLVSNGTFYWARRRALQRDKTFYGQRLKGFLVPDSQVSDIDTWDDYLKVSEKLIYRSKEQKLYEAG